MSGRIAISDKLVTYLLTMAHDSENIKQLALLRPLQIVTKFNVMDATPGTFLPQSVCSWKKEISPVVIGCVKMLNDCDFSFTDLLCLCVFHCINKYY